MLAVPVGPAVVAGSCGNTRRYNFLGWKAIRTTVRAQRQLGCYEELDVERDSLVHDS